MRLQRGALSEASFVDRSERIEELHAIAQRLLEEGLISIPAVIWNGETEEERLAIEKVSHWLVLLQLQPFPRSLALKPRS